MQIPPQQADEAGNYHFLIDSMDVRCFYAAGQVCLTSELVRLPTEPKERLDLSKKVLNLALTKGAVDQSSVYQTDNGDALALYRQMPMSGLTLDMFIKRVGQFVDAVEYFAQNLVRQTAESVPPYAVMMP